MTEVRPDDRPEVVGRRLSEDARESGPLLAWLEARELLATVDGVGSIAAVADRVRAAVAAVLGVGASVS